MKECKCGSFIIEGYRCPACGSTEFGQLNIPRERNTRSTSKDYGPSLGDYRRNRILEGKLKPFPEQPLKKPKAPTTGSGTAFITEFKRKKWGDYHGRISYREYRGEPTGPRGQKGEIGDIKLVTQPRGLVFALQTRPGFYSEVRRMVSIDIGIQHTYSHYSDVLSSDPSRTKQGTADQLTIWDQFWYSLQIFGWKHLDDVGLNWYSKRLFKPLECGGEQLKR